MKKSKILVTGGAGFIGSNLARKLYNQGHSVTIFDVRTEHLFLKGLRIRAIKGDVRNYGEVLKAVKGQDYVYHLASCNRGNAEERDIIFGVNVSGTRNVMKACITSNVKKVVHVSSGSVLGFSTEESRKLNENDVIDLKDQFYAQAKKLGEDEVQNFIKRGLNATIVIPAYVVGAGEINPSRLGVFKSIAKNRIRFTYPGGTGTVAVEDMVDGMLLAMEKGKTGERYIFCSDNIRLFDLYNLIAKLLKKQKIRIRLPSVTYYPLYFAGAVLQRISRKPIIATEIVRWSCNFRYYDSTKARKELGWKPKIPLEESLIRAIKYYRTIGALE